MGTAMQIERARSDIEVLARAGLDVATFLEEVDESLQRAVPHAAMCVSLHDPATSMATATFKFGSIAQRESHDLQWCEVEYGEVDTTSFRSLISRGDTAIGVHEETDGEPDRSVRMRHFMSHHFGFTDELRTVASIDGRDWGAFSMMRADAGRPFDADHIACMRSLSRPLAAGIRSGVLARCAAVTEPLAVGPAVIIVRSDDTIAQVNVGAEHWLSQLAGCDNSEGPVHTLAALVDGARRYARGESDVLARSRVRLRSGTWLVLNCSPLSGPDSTGTDVVITIEEARPPEIVPLVVAAFELSPRERDVTQLVLQGVASKGVASALNISVHTVQDHLKAVFEKADVCSRRELIARFFDQYMPRLGAEIAPSGWFSPSGAAAPPANDAARQDDQRASPASAHA